MIFPQNSSFKSDYSYSSHPQDKGRFSVPTGNLDSKNSSEVIALLKDAARRYEQTIIMITHNRVTAQSAVRILQAKAHKRQNRMTIFCIMLAVILITGVFTMADMEYCHKNVRMMEKHGNWHIALKNITKEEAKAVSKEMWIKEGCWYDVVNYDLAEDYSVDGKQTMP